MELLKFILRLPFYILQKSIEIISYFIIFLIALFKGILWFLNPIIGDIKWSTPSWLPELKKAYTSIGLKLNKFKTLIGTTIILSIIAFFSVNYAYHWYLNRPKPIEPAPIIIHKYSASVYSPDTSNIGLVINFSGSGYSPAPLENINKVITEGIIISPEIQGTWKWTSDKSVEFIPESKKWPLGVEYTITLDDTKLFAENNLLNSDQTIKYFVTKDFSYKFANSGELYLDPTLPDNRQVINKIEFSHPVDKNSFEKNINLSLYQTKGKEEDSDKFLKSIDFTINYDKNDTIAYVKSSAIPLLEKEGYLKISIDKGVISTDGGHPTRSLLSNTVSVPEKYNLSITNSAINLIEVSDQKIEQVLMLSFSHDVKATDVEKAIRVWQLPKSKDKEYKIRYYDKLSNSYKTKFQINDQILNNAKIISLKTIDSELPYQKQISFAFKAEQSSELYIQVLQPLPSYNGYFLKDQYQEVLTIPNYPISLGFAAEGSLLSLSGDKKLPVVSRNITDIKLKIDRVIPSQLQHLIAFNEHYNFENMDFGDLSNDHFVEKYNYDKNITGSPEELKYTEVDLSRFLTVDTDGKQNRGVFLLRLYGKSINNPDVDFYESRFIMVTDLGIISKKSLDQSYDLFIQSIDTGKPINNAKVSILGMNGITITSQSTDNTGHVKFEPLSEYYQGIRPTLFVVEKDGDLSFLPINASDRKLYLSRFDIGGIRETLQGGELSSHIFSDRGIYRPGDTFHIGTIIRAEKWANSLAGITIDAEIYDPKSNLVLKKPIVLDKSGFNELSYKTNYESPTGDWHINLYLKNEDNDDDYRILLGTSSVVVREFEPDKTAVTLKLLPEIKDGWSKPDQLIAEIHAKNLFGTDAADRRVTNTLILEPSVPHFKKYEDYYFYQYISGSRNSFKVELDELQTDDNGKVIVNLNDNMESFEGNYTLRMLTEVFEPDSGRSVAATATTFVSPNEYLVGAKSDGSLSYINRDATRYIDFITINPSLNKIPLSDLKLTIIEEKYLSVLVKQPSGVYKYESRKKENVISEEPFAISQEKTTYKIDSKNPGNYKIQLRANDGQLLYQSHYNVVGEANVTRDLDRDAELMLKIKQKAYNPGDEIEIAITAPYVGSGIITIERDKVYAWKWFHTDTTSSIQKITLPKDMTNNGYINVQFIRDPNSEEIFMSPLSYGVIPFKISNEQFNDKIVLKAPKTIKPGDTLPITLKTNTPQKAVIFAIDEGILQVSNYKLSDPLNSFLRKKALSVRTSQILDLILPEFRHLLNISAPGGDADSEDALSGHLNPFKRKIDEPVAFWSGLIDVEGTKTVEYKVPDYFNGKIRIMAISVGEQTMGHTQMSTTVHNDIVLQPNAPYFAAPNDQFEVSLNVTNLIENIGEQSVPIKVKVSTTPHLTIIDEDQHTIELANGKTGSLKFKFKANEMFGSADFHFTASYGDIIINRNVSTSIRPITEYRLQTIMGRMDGSKETFSDFRDMYENFSKREASVSFSPFILSKGLSTYLENYPHFCSEQIVSRAIPVLIAGKYRDFNLASKQGLTPLSELFQILQSRQNDEGAIGLWYSTYNVDPFITLYAVNFMLEAKEMGQVIPQKMLDNANKYLEQLAQSSYSNNYNLRLRAYAIYLLTRQNKVTTNYLASLLSDLKRNDSSWQTDLTALYVASSYQMLKMDKEANKLLKPIWQDLESAYNHAWWTHNYYDPLVINAGKIYLISKHFPERAKEIPAQALENMVLMLNKQKYTTQSSAMTILALSSYSSSIDNAKLKNDSLQINTISKDNGVEKQKIIAKLKGILAKGQFSAQDSTLNVINSTDYPAWYLISQQGYDRNIPQKPIKQGLEVYREFTDLDGNPVEQVKLGDKINVTVQIRAIAKEGATNIAIVDLLPGGFEVIQQPITPTNELKGEYTQDDDEYEENDDYSEENHFNWVSPIAIKTGNNTWYPEYTDVREDRVIIYGSTSNNKIQKFTYQIKATSVGTYTVPPAFGEAMYDRDIQAVSKGGNTITIRPNE